MTQLAPRFSSQGLITKEDFDNVERIKEKPTVGTAGSSENSSNSAKSEGGSRNTPILSEEPNLYKQTGSAMSTEGFIKIPRSLLNDSRWKSLRLKYKHVFLTLLQNTSYQEKTYCIGTNVIKIFPGQFCTSIRNLVELCNQELKFKEDFVDKNIVERSVSVFLQFDFVRHEVRHKKSVFTISYPELYDHFKNQSETATETKPRHNRDINEERKEREDRLKGTFNEETSEKHPSQEVAFSPLSNQEVEENILVLMWHFSEKGLLISEKTTRVWLRKNHSSDYIIATAALLIDQKNKGGKVKKNDEAWMETALKQGYATKKSNEKINGEFAYEFKNKKSWTDLHITQKYCTLGQTSKDLQFSMHPETFKKALVASYDNLFSSRE